MTDESEKIMPRAHQGEALAGLEEALAREDRVQAHMCCGSGKTYTQAFLARSVIEAAEDPGLVVVVCFVPNRALIHQNARNFKKVFGQSVDYLGVCSDGEQAVDDEHDAPLDTTTDRVSIARFLARQQKPRIVVSTYQSAPTLREALSLARGEEFIDLGLFDEAHRTAGNKSVEDLFAYALEDKNFPMLKRGFFTATPRIIEGKNTSGISMSDPDMYGPVAYEYPFSRGIKDGNVVDYDLWVPVITRREVAQFMQDRNIEGEERAAVSMIALEKVMEKTGQTRFLTYHNRIAASKAFAAQLTKVIKDATVAHVDGSTPGPERDRMMAALGTGRTILTNCKAFVEGVDAPGLQGVLFVDPRKSVVDVVQAVGRLSRPDPNDPTKRGSIIAPILTESADPAALARAAQTSGFQTLVQVAEALRANDDALEEDILERSRAVARGDTEIKPLHNLQVLGPDDEDVDVSVLADAITVATMEDLKDGFAAMVGSLEKHIAQHGYLPTKGSDARLHSWMVGVRKKHAHRRLEPAHAALLDTVEGWTWIGERARVETIVSHVSAFRDRMQRMPSGRHGTAAEEDLHAYVMEAQEDYLRYGPGRRQKATVAFEEENLLFFTDEILGKRAHQSGAFRIVEMQDGVPEVWFHPRVDKHRKTVPVFRSGHTVVPRPIRIFVGRTERERLMALAERHSVRITLARAGRDKDPFKDGRIVEWHAGTVDREEGPETSKESFGWFVARFLDRKVSGRPAYTLTNLQAREIKENKPATTLHPLAPEGTVGDVLERLVRVRRAFRDGQLDEAVIRALDALPGFSWVEAIEDAVDVERTLERFVTYHGLDILSNREARLGDKGVANTLRVFDAVVESGMVISPESPAGMALVSYKNEMVGNIE